MSTRGICVMGRRSFGTGIGLHTEAFLELLSRRYDVQLFDVHQRSEPADTVTLNSGRVVPLTPDLDGFGVYVYVDVIWNGVSYAPPATPPPTGHRIAYLAFDSDQLPPEWVDILNRDFDAVYFTSPHLIDLARRSGVEIHLGSLPLALDLSSQLAGQYRPPAGRRVRFGTISAYHPRKGLEALVAAFLQEFGGDAEAELLIHSNVAMGPTAAAVTSLVEIHRAANVVLSTDDLSDAAKNELIESFDVYVNASAGEGYSIGPREALAAGKVLVLADLQAHLPLFSPPGVFRVGSSHEVPAVYPEIDNRRFGSQKVIAAGPLRAALRRAHEFVSSDEAPRTAGQRKMLAAEFDRETLERGYWELVDPDSRRLTPDARSDRHIRIPPAHREMVRAHAGPHGSRLGARRVTIPAHDGGFFSLFNTYATHLTWSMHDSPQPLVVPDWDASRFLKRHGDHPVVSFCYARPGQGNLWNHLFQPPYDLSPNELEDPDLFWGAGAEVPADLHNASREPLLTYIHAYRLYQSPAFQRIRRQYNAVLDRHARLLPHLQQEIDNFLAEHQAGRFMVSAHIKHPSHAVEQPDGSMADRHAYIDHVRRAVLEHGIAVDSEDWTVFLATEQERVVDLFREEFGDRVIRFADVQRIPTEVDTLFDALPEQEKSADGHQLQHIMAADTDRWSPRLAWEVIRDAKVMAAADVMFHAVSNVATAASFFNPSVDMRYVGS